MSDLPQMRNRRLCPDYNPDEFSFTMWASSSISANNI